MKEKSVQLKALPQREINSMLVSFQKGQYEVARDIALSITKKFPEHLLSWKVLGAVFGLTGQMEEALSANQNAVRLDPKDAEPHNNLGNVLKGLGRLEEAEASYRQAIELKPDYTEAHYNLGKMLDNFNRLEEAEASYRQAIRINKDYHAAVVSLGNVLMKKGEHKEGLINFRIAEGSIFFNIKNGFSVKREI
ncbi:MAG: tetratricopeptide repeat protein [Gammaproteobacteria bacterium]|nr:tetratricopeptide repeat protein [Gammaproteobacteria bacterium]